MPTIKTNTKQLDITFNERDTIILADHMPVSEEIRISIKGKFVYFKNTIIELFDKAGFEFKNKTFISDHYLLFEDFTNFEIDVKKNIFIRNAREFLVCDCKDLNHNDIKYKFTFMSNKAKYHRTLCSTIIANLFDKNEIVYSYNTNDMVPHDVISSELLLGTDYNFDLTKYLPEQHFFINHLGKKEPWGAVVNYAASNATAYQFLYSRLYKNSLISIVTEPCFFERGNMLTEKTLMAIYARHFMIWPGAWRLPETVKKLGFDIFDDVLDHSYQYIEHPGMRVVEAFKSNIKFLSDVRLQKKFHQMFSDRFENNLNLAKNITQLIENLKNLNKIK